MKYLTIIQARLSSSRLPRKSLMPIAGIPLAHLCAIRAKNDFSRLIVATSNEASDDDLAEMLLEAGVEVFRGSLNNVLSRFIDIADDHLLSDEDAIIRLTGDNPIVDGKFLEILKSHWERLELDYLSAEPKDIENSAWPKGLSAEFVKVGLLRNSFMLDKSGGNLEHVTQYVRANTPNKAFGDEVTGLHFVKKLYLGVDDYDDYKRVCSILTEDTVMLSFLEIINKVSDIQWK
jgi:spore coat polysaccharide biosynthesis protein SpsF (cytidylyltransferase family)